MYFNAGKKQQNYDSSGSDSGTNEVSNQQHQHLTQQHPNQQHPNKQHPHHQHHQITSKFNLLHQNITIQQNPQFNNPIYQPFFCEKCRLPVLESTICEIRHNRAKSGSNSTQYFHHACVSCTECQTLLFGESRCFKRGNQVSRLVCARCFLGHCYRTERWLKNLDRGYLKKFFVKFFFAFFVFF